MQKVFGWTVRWEGETQNIGYGIHVGNLDQYIAIYKPRVKITPYQRSYALAGHVNHIGIVFDDLNEIEARVKSAGFHPHMHADYEPGRRFYFYDDTGLEIEVVSHNS